MGEDRGVHRVLVGNPEGKRTLGRPRRRWENNIKMDLQEVGASDSCIISYITPFHHRLKPVI
jgi:hypothetical protein